LLVPCFAENNSQSDYQWGNKDVRRQWKSTMHSHTPEASAGILVDGFDLSRFCSALLVLSETVLVLVIENKL
jgi:hypothetical protein